MRDAVGNLRPSGTVKEPSLKRLRSVVSTSTGESSLVDRPRRIQSIARVPNPMATVIRAVQEAAEDVKVKSSKSVFDRLGREMDISDTEQVRDMRDLAVEDEEFNQIPEKTLPFYHQIQGVDIGIVDSETRLAGDSMFDNEGYDDGDDDDVLGHRVIDVCETGTSGGKMLEDSLMGQYRASNADDVMRITRIKDHDQPVSSAKTSLNFSTNLNSRKPPNFQEPREVAEMGNWRSVEENEEDAGKSTIQAMRENGNPVMVGNGNVRWLSCLDLFFPLSCGVICHFIRSTCL